VAFIGSQSVKYLLLIYLILILIVPNVIIYENCQEPKMDISESGPIIEPIPPIETEVESEIDLISTRSNGDDDETPFSNDWVEGVYGIEFQEPAFVNIETEFEIYEIDLGEIYGNVTAADIRVWSEGNPGSTILTYLKSHVEKNIFSKFLEITFPNGDYNYQAAVVTPSTLTVENVNDYYPPVEISITGYVILDENTYFSESELDKYNITNINDLIEGSLKMGAKITQTMRFAAKAGHYNEFVISVPRYSIYQHPDQLTIYHKYDEDKESDYVIIKRIDNKDGNISEIEYMHDIAFRSSNPTPALKPGIKEDIDIQLEIDVQNFNEVYIPNSLLEINVVDLRDSTITLPQNITELSFMSSDGIRLYYANGIIDENDIQEHIDDQLSKTSDSLEEKLNSTRNIDLELSWNFASIIDVDPLYYIEDTGVYTRMGSSRAVKGYIRALGVIEPRFFESNLTQKTIYGFLNAGAQAEVDLRMKIKYDYSINLTLPEGLRLKNKIGIPGLRDSYLINELEANEILIISKNAPDYDSNRADINVEIDINELEMVNLNQFISDIKIEVKGVLFRILSSAHAGFSTILPKKISMEYVNSDAFRLAYYENLLDLKEITDEIYDIIQANLTKVFEGSIVPSIQFDEKSMDFDGNIDKMDDDVPIKFTIIAEGEMKIGSGGGGTFGSLSTTTRPDYDGMVLSSFVSHDIELPLVGKYGWNTSYKIIMPHYIEIIGTPKLENLTGSSTDVHTGTADDGRHYMEITIYSEDSGVKNLKAVVGIEINITPWFFLSKIIIPLILSCILLISIIYIYFKRRKKQKLLEKETGVAGVTVQDIAKHDKKRSKKKGKNKYFRGVARDQKSHHDMVIEEYPEDVPPEPSSSGEQYMPDSTKELYTTRSGETDYKKMVREMVPKHEGKIEKKKHKKLETAKGKKKSKGKRKGRKKLGSVLSVFILISISMLFPSTTVGQYDEDFISKPGNIPVFQFSKTSSIEPGDSGELKFSIENRYPFNMENVTLNLNIYKYVTLEKSKDVKNIDNSPKIVHGSGGTRYSILDSQTIMFQWSSIHNNTQENVKIKISTSKETLEGTYFIRMSLSFEYRSEIYNMKSRGYYSQEEWDYAKNTATPTDPGEFNLTALDVNGIIVDTSFRVKEPIPFWPLAIFIGLCILFAFLAGLFYLMDEHGKFPKLKVKIDRVTEKIIKRKK
jgi:hypothetical protein